jgi:hypothetical protein
VALLDEFREGRAVVNSNYALMWEFWPCVPGCWTEGVDPVEQWRLNRVDVCATQKTSRSCQRAVGPFRDRMKFLYRMSILLLLHGSANAGATEQASGFLKHRKASPQSSSSWGPPPRSWRARVPK